MLGAGGSSMGQSPQGGMAAPNFTFNQTPSNGASSGGSKSDGKAHDEKWRSKYRRPNWALPNQKVNSIGVTRPIRVQVLPDRLVVVPEAGDDRRPQQIPISPPLLPRDVDKFVGAVQNEMKGWGLAVQNGYWKPQIIMDVAPGAEQQSNDLQMALEGSGFDLQRKLR